MLQADTLNRQAFTLYNAAKRQVSKYERTLDLTELDTAMQNLDEAILADSNFFKPANFKGIIYDMKGQSDNAIRQFDSILEHSPTSLKDEVEYNKAVANYHRYSEQYIKEAIDILEKLDRKSDLQAKLALLVKAVLAQSYAMMVLHASWRNSKEEITAFTNATEKKASEALSQADKMGGLGDSFLKQPRWISNNAKGISLMFVDDKMRDEIKKEDAKPYLKRLQRSIEYFDKAGQYSANNWAVECNKASSRMRLAHLYKKIGENEKADKLFAEAEPFLKNVINKLRPDYDFAIYELGRINRFKGNMPLAEDYLKKVIDMPDTNRNVSVKTLKKELDAAKQGLTQFNPPVQNS